MLSYQETIRNLVNRATFFSFKNSFILSIIAGFFISLGCFLMINAGIVFNEYKSFAMSSVFGLALMLIVLAGSELFTGQCMIQTFGIGKKEVSFRKFVKNLSICWVGNFIGALIGVILFKGTIPSDSLVNLINIMSLTKTSYPILPLFCKAVFCNILVCLAIWISTRCENTSTKLLIIWWCVFAFVFCGFEHSIANMPLLSLGYSYESISLVDLIYNLSIVSIGNFIGGMLVSIGYLKGSK